MAEGVAHAPDALLLSLTAAPTATGAAQGAARCTAAKSLDDKDMRKLASP
jgi:hypothetical protein